MEENPTQPCVEDALRVLADWAKDATEYARQAQLAEIDGQDEACKKAWVAAVYCLAKAAEAWAVYLKLKAQIEAGPPEPRKPVRRVRPDAPVITVNTSLLERFYPGPTPSESPCVYPRAEESEPESAEDAGVVGVRFDASLRVDKDQIVDTYTAEALDNTFNAWLGLVLRGDDD